VVGGSAPARTPPAGAAPSRDRAYAVRNAVTVAFLTTTIRNIPVEVRLTVADGVPKECVVNLDLINTIPKAALSSRVCALSKSKLADVETAIRFALDIR
jgi:mRNA interferase MazF